MKNILLLSIFVLILSSCVHESERQKKAKSINLQSKELLDSALNLNPKRNIYVGIRSLDTTGITAKYLKIRKDSAELGLVYAVKINEEINRLRHNRDSICEAYSKSWNEYTFNLNPYWSEDDCEKLENGQIWIGMSLDMVIYKKRSRPSSHNVSDYGNGKQHQWCYDYGSPSCFYGGDDWIITGYN